MGFTSHWLGVSPVRGVGEPRWFWILNARVENTLQNCEESLPNLFQVSQGEIALIQLPVHEAIIDDSADEFFHLRRR